MGVWGTGIFQDDTACDIRDDYRDLIGNGSSGKDATRQILKSYASSLADPDASGVVWLALAATQWKLGRLESEILAKALDVIDSGTGLNRWTPDTKDFARRRAALIKLRAEITTPQPPEKKVAKRVKCECDWDKGELVALKLLSDSQVILRVIGHHTDKGGKYPVCEILDWVGDSIPEVGELKRLEIMWSRPDFKHKVSKIMIVGMNKRAAARTVKLGMELKPAQNGDGIPLFDFIGVQPKEKGQRASVVHWKYLDKFLKEWFLLE